jgi:formylglycine-generating enzyme required for sulfatase activity
MAQTETTVEQFEACAAAGECSSLRAQLDSDMKTCNWKNRRGGSPMNCLNWAEAEKYCRWVGGRLPTAVEWEYAAKSGAPTIYPWGDEKPSGNRANFCDRNCPDALNDAAKKNWKESGWVSEGVNDGWAGTAPVKLYPGGATAWGLYDMAGNVWEWTATDYDSSKKEVRGGSWNGTPASLRASYRNSYAPSAWNDDLGFRCAQ